MKIELDRKEAEAVFEDFCRRMFSTYKVESVDVKTYGSVVISLEKPGNIPDEQPIPHPPVAVPSSDVDEIF